MMNKNEKTFAPLPVSTYWLFLLGILISIGIAFFIYTKVSYVVQQQSAAELERLSYTASDHLSVRLQQMKYGMAQAASEKYVQTAIENREIDQLNRLLNGWNTQRRYVELWAVLDPQGRIITSLRGETATTAPLALNGLVKQTLLSGSPLISTEQISKNEIARIGQNVIYRLQSNARFAQEGALVQLVIVPAIGEDGRVMGALCTGLVLNDNQELMSSILNNTRVSSAIYQGRYHISSFSESDENRFPQHLRPAMTQTATLSGKSYVGSMQLGANLYVAVSQPIYNARSRVIGYQVVALPQSEYSQLPSWVRNASIMIGLLLAVFFILATLNMSRLKQLAERERNRSKESYHLRLFAQRLQECTEEDEIYQLLKQNLSRDLLLNQIELNVFTDTANCMERINFTEDDLILRSSLERGKCKPMISGRINIYNSSNDIPCLQVDTGIVKSHICTPFLSGGKVSGVVGLGSPEEHYWTHDRIEYLTAYLNFMGPAVTNLRLLKLLQARAFEDPLTGLKNRRFLDQYLTEQLAIAERYQRPLSILMADIDLFKKVNDDYGHDVGDLVLKEVARTILLTARNSDLVARYGGEEFVLVLPDTESQDAVALAERFRQAIASMQVIHSDYGKAIHITISIGVASFPNDGHSLESLYKLSDSALYLAKHRGRNQVRSAPEYLETLKQSDL